MVMHLMMHDHAWYKNGKRQKDAPSSGPASCNQINRGPSGIPLERFNQVRPDWKCKKCAKKAEWMVSQIAMQKKVDEGVLTGAVIAATTIAKIPKMLRGVKSKIQQQTNKLNVAKQVKSKIRSTAPIKAINKVKAKIKAPGRKINQLKHKVNIGARVHHARTNLQHAVKAHLMSGGFMAANAADHAASKGIKKVKDVASRHLHLSSGTSQKWHHALMQNVQRHINTKFPKMGVKAKMTVSNSPHSGTQLHHVHVHVPTPPQKGGSTKTQTGKKSTGKSMMGKNNK